MKWRRGLLGVIVAAFVPLHSPAVASGQEWAALESQVPTIHPRIVWRDSTGREVTPDSLDNTSGNIRWFIEDRDGVSDEAVGLFDRGRAAGSESKYDEALTLLWRAHQASPGWLYPVYEAAFTYFLIGNLEEAERLYAWIDRMEPRGYWTTKESLDCIRRERAGEYTAKTCESYARLEFESRSLRLAKLEKLVQRVPKFAPAWKDLAVLRQDRAGRMQAVEAGLASQPDAETRGFLLIHKSNMLAGLGNHAEADAIRARLLSDPTSTMQTRALAEMAQALQRRTPSPMPDGGRP